MKKILGLLLVIAACIACENDTKNSDPGLQAYTNNEEYKEAVKYEKWKPERMTAYIANENVLYIMGETDSTSYVMKVPYSPSLFGKTIKLEEYRKVENGGKQANIQFDNRESTKDDAYAYYRVKSKSSLDETFALYVTRGIDKNKNEVEMGEVYFAPEADQIPGTISGTFFANLIKEDLDETQQKNFTEKQKEEHAALQNTKIFQEGVFFRIPLELPR
ncbi:MULTISPECIES: hypothetical protein [Myroides]|uniref:Uncharacterized protein n=1 Tax=Myroides albus TaxID=2562892 RepID=A0A6I3LPZ2_9FLAO|nr:MULTISPECIES: hypothetical protein [Myroides]MTG98035.1 hypothetical protein [Myroides albus]MVX36148.1 hypothetical protein [Myroides sp. LoEW2-1]UVD80783.1 hypothetical protein NWE55_05955 [Myroides albus]